MKALWTLKAAVSCIWQDWLGPASSSSSSNSAGTFSSQFTTVSLTLVSRHACHFLAVTRACTKFAVGNSPTTEPWSCWRSSCCCAALLGFNHRRSKQNLHLCSVGCQRSTPQHLSVSSCIGQERIHDIETTVLGHQVQTPQCRV